MRMNVHSCRRRYLPPRTPRLNNSAVVMIFIFGITLGYIAGLWQQLAQRKPRAGSWEMRLAAQK